MSGFLSRLGERAVGASRLVEPRLRSRFEPDAQFTVAAPMEIEEFMDVPRADLATPGAQQHAPIAPAGSRTSTVDRADLATPGVQHHAPIAPAGSRASTVDRGATASPGTPRQPVPATQQVRGSAPRAAAHEDVAAETVSAQVERGVEPVSSPGAPASEPAPRRPPEDMGATRHDPQHAARAGADHASAPRHSLAADPDARATPIASNSAKPDAVAQEAPIDQKTFVERPVTETEPEGDDPVFTADTPIDGSRFLASSLPVDDVGAAMERAPERARPAASTHVRSAKTWRHEVRRQAATAATAAIDGDHDHRPMDGAAIDVERSTRRMDGAESMRLEHPVDSEAVVHVRIGRIDVRAAAPPPPAVQRSSQPRVESLDDYLKRTSGRR